jgi:hypothetical protein
VTDRPAAVLAHGLGGSTDLPIPYTYALIGPAWALTFTFAVVAFAWRKPRFDPTKPGRPLPLWVTTATDAPVTRRELPGLMAHSLIPIVLGYVCAHYLSYLVERGQQTVIGLADPLGRGWNLLGLGDAEVNYILSLHPSVLATIKVCCVVGGHVAGVIAAHDRALRVLPAGYQLTGQLSMMLVMVGYTFTGLYLLFGG